MDTSKWFPKGSRRRFWFGFGLTSAGLGMALFTLELLARGGLPLMP